MRLAQYCRDDDDFWGADAEKLTLSGNLRLSIFGFLDSNVDDTL